MTRGPDPETLLQQAEALRGQGRRRDAVALYKRLLTLRPDLTDTWYNLGFLLKAEGRYDEALAAYDEALARGVAGPEEVHLNRALIYADHLRREAAAEDELNAALRFNPSYAPALLNLGNLHEERGAREAAAGAYERLLGLGEAAQPTERAEAMRGEARARLGHLRPPTSLDDPSLQALQAAASSDSLDAMTRANLYFALGRAYDALGAYDVAFQGFEAANRQARRTGRAYDSRRAEQTTAALIAAFPENSLQTETTVDLDSPRETAAPPLFICGLFRSGSTLVEQVLAGHPEIEAGGEMPVLGGLAAALPGVFPESVARLSPAHYAALAADYRREAVRLFPEKARERRLLTDKRPDNFLLIGFIKRLFPEAKIIHTVRAPLDNALSVYVQHLDQTHLPYASDLGAIGHYFGEHRRLMAHWRALYPDSVFDFDYDAFVRNPEPALRRLLDFLGLDWAPACLDFHRRENTVKTASYWQVRRPLYGDASGRWRHYAAHLGDLREALARAGVPVET